MVCTVSFLINIPRIVKTFTFKLLPGITCSSINFTPDATQVFCIVKIKIKKVI